MLVAVLRSCDVGLGRQPGTATTRQRDARVGAGLADGGVHSTPSNGSRIAAWWVQGWSPGNALSLRVLPSRLAVLLDAIHVPVSSGAGALPVDAIGRGVRRSPDSGAALP